MDKINCKRNCSIDTLKFFASLFVVGIHTEPFLNVNNKYINFIGIILNSVFRVAVPIFFMSSGYLLYKKINRGNVKYLFKYIKGILKVLIIAIAFHLIYFLIKKKMLFGGDIFLEIKNIIIYFSSNISSLYYGYDDYLMYHLWYLFSLIYIVPIIYLFINKLNILLIISGLLNLSGVILGLLNINRSFRDALFFGLFYVTVGCYISKNEYIIKEKLKFINLKKLFITIIIFLIFQFIEVLLQKNLFKVNLDYFIMTIPASIVIFLLCIKDRNILRNTIINRIGEDSVGIYVIHVVIKDVIQLMCIIINEKIMATITWNIILTPLVFIISYLVYKLYLKIISIVYMRNTEIIKVNSTIQ